MFSHNYLNHALSALLFTVLFALSQAAVSAPSFLKKDITEVGWSVEMTGVSYDPVTNTTTFNYRLDAASTEKDLSHWVLSVDNNETPITAISPDAQTSYGLDPTTGTWGVKWDAGQDAGTSMTYSVTVHGNVSTTDINYAVKGGTYYAVGTTQGPGVIIPDNTTYSVSGVLFVDANSNLLFDIGEPFISSVTIQLYDATGMLVASVQSDAFGHYAFTGLTAGEYQVVIPEASEANDFNRVLMGYLTPVGPLLVSVGIIDRNVDDTNFGFGLNTQGILADLDSSDPDYNGFTFPGEGRTIGFWKHQLTVAIKNKGRAQVDAAIMLSYLNMIEVYLLPIPFQFTNGDEFAHALSILEKRTSVGVALLEKQLLATEFNQMAGLGLAGGYAPLQHLILGWAEFLVSNEAAYSREALLEAKDILDSINNLGH